MKFFTVTLLLLLPIAIYSQSVNQKVILQLVQANLLRIDAGADLSLSESGTAIIGENISINGGTPEYTYTWSDNQGNAYFEQSPLVSQIGSYYLTVTDQNNCTSRDSVSMSSFKTGTEVLLLDHIEILHFDNQKQTLHVKLGKSYSNVLVRIIGIDGKCHYSHSFTDSSFGFDHHIDVSTFSKGIYILSASFRNEQFAKKFTLN